MPTPERLTALKIITAFNTQDLPLLLSLRTPTCLRHIHPLSLSIPPQSNTEYLASLTQLQSLFTSFHLTVTDVLEDTEQRKIAMWVRAEGETVVGKYVNEYVWRMGFEEGGERVCEWNEFVDVGMVRDFWPRLRGILDKEGGGKEGAEGEEKASLKR